MPAEHFFREPYLVFDPAISPHYEIPRLRKANAHHHLVSCKFPHRGQGRGSRDPIYDKGRLPGLLLK
nr:unnamed protein product [Digitaria exilis]